MAVDTWEHKAGMDMDTHEIIDHILRQSGIEGVTFLGGEPFEQSEALAEIAGACKEKGLSIICFSGYTLEELQNSEKKEVQYLLSKIDLLIDGPYVQEEREFKRPWVGSANQKFRFLTNRYSEKMLEMQKNKVEIRIAPGGVISINGMTDFEKAYEGGTT